MNDKKYDVDYFVSIGLIAIIPEISATHPFTAMLIEDAMSDEITDADMDLTEARDVIDYIMML